MPEKKDRLGEILETLCEDYLGYKGVGCSHQFDQAKAQIKELMLDEYELAVLIIRWQFNMSIDEFIKYMKKDSKLPSDGLIVVYEHMKKLAHTITQAQEKKMKGEE